MTTLNTDELLRAAFAPWDERSWEKLRELYPDTAAALETAVRAGLTPQQVRDYCDEGGYPPGVGKWMAQAMMHLARQRPTLWDGTPPIIAPREGDAATLDEIVDAIINARPSLEIRDGEPALHGTARVGDAADARLQVDYQPPRGAARFTEAEPAPIDREIVVTRHADGRPDIVADGRGLRYAAGTRTHE